MAREVFDGVLSVIGHGSDGHGDSRRFRLQQLGMNSAAGLISLPSKKEPKVADMNSVLSWFQKTKAVRILYWKMTSRSPARSKKAPADAPPRRVRRSRRPSGAPKTDPSPTYVVRPLRGRAPPGVSKTREVYLQGTCNARARAWSPRASRVPRRARSREEVPWATAVSSSSRAAPGVRRLTRGRTVAAAAAAPATPGRPRRRARGVAIQRSPSGARRGNLKATNDKGAR